MNEPARQSVIVIGGGIIGIACAHYLNEAGCSVTILESGTMAGACSHGNCGYLCPSHALPLAAPEALREGIASLLDPRAAFRIEPRLDTAFVNWMWQFARRCTTPTMLRNGHHLHALLQSSMAEFVRLIDGEVAGSQWKRTGLLYAFQTSKGAEAFSRTAAILRENYGIRSDWLSGQELVSLDDALKPGLAGGVHFPEDASVRPDRLAAGWVESLQRKGVRVLEHMPVEAIERKGGGIASVMTPQGRLSADHYVLATGAVSGRLARLFGANLPIEPGKGYSITMKRPARTPRVPVLFPEHHVGITPFDDAFRIGSMMEFVGFSETIPPHRVAQLRDAAAHYLADELPPANVEQWFGWRPMTWDSLPIIGAFEGIENLCCATGHNMLGMSLAPATGKLVAELVLGQPPHLDPLPYSPTRF